MLWSVPRASDDKHGTRSIASHYLHGSDRTKWNAATRLEQVFVNLLTNAAKYTEKGGRIAVTAGVEGGDFIVRVRDTGEGISAEMLPRLFEMFTQVESSTHRSRGGLRIGLSLVKALVEMHGRSVQVASEGIGRGSEFSVRLPALAR